MFVVNLRLSLAIKSAVIIKSHGSMRARRAYPVTGHIPQPRPPLLEHSHGLLAHEPVPIDRRIHAHRISIAPHRISIAPHQHGVSTAPALVPIARPSYTKRIFRC